MPPPDSFMKCFRMLAASAILLLGYGKQTLSQVDSLKDSTKAKIDTVLVVPEQERLTLPSEEERTFVLAVGMVILAGFLVLLVLKRREADSEAGIP